MKLMFLCKKRPQQRDLLQRPYGRFHYLPQLLADMGHEVRVVLADYKNGPEQQSHNKDPEISWYSYPALSIRSNSFLKKALYLANNYNPDFIIGFSDIYYGILATYLANKTGCKSVIDAYDNYESYMPYAFPLHWLWRNAISRADIVTVAGPTLANIMNRYRYGKRKADIVPMAADPEFEPMNSNLEFRHKYKLPVDKKLIGYTGSIHSTRGVDVLFSAYDYLQENRGDIRLVFSGNSPGNIILPRDSIHLGYIDDSDLPLLVNSLDVLTSINKSSNFGNYSYPAKLYEAMACNKPVATSKTGSTAWILKNHPRLLCDPENPEALASTIEYCLDQDGYYTYEEQPDWHDCARLMHDALNVG